MTPFDALEPNKQIPKGPSAPMDIYYNEMHR